MNNNNVHSGIMHVTNTVCYLQLSMITLICMLSAITHPLHEPTVHLLAKKKKNLI